MRRDLHDGLGPSLASLTLKLDAARNLVDRDPGQTKTLLAEVKRQTQGSIAEIRRLVYDLRPPALDELGLVSAIREHATRTADVSGLQVVVDVPVSLPPLPAAVEVAAYRIVLEAVTNVVRHAAAQRCIVWIQVTDALRLAQLGRQCGDLCRRDGAILLGIDYQHGHRGPCQSSPRGPICAASIHHGRRRLVRIRLAPANPIGFGRRAFARSS